ncbi:MAG: cation-transporting P-type ATPase, partial [Flavobacterium sp.]
MSESNTTSIQGLSSEEVIASRTKNGANSTEHQQKNNFLHSLFELIKEPMFLLLLTASSVYFITADYNNGIFMLLAIILV